MLRELHNPETCEICVKKERDSINDFKRSYGLTGKWSDFDTEKSSTVKADSIVSENTKNAKDQSTHTKDIETETLIENLLGEGTL